HHPRNEPHVPMNCDDVWETRKNGIQCAVQFCALAMHDIRAKLAQFLAYGSDAALVCGAHPAESRHVKMVKPSIVGQLLLRFHRLTGARDDVNLYVWNSGQPLQQSRRGGAKT